MVIEENECGALLYAYGTEITNTHRFECHCGGENISECIGLPPEFLITLFKLLCSISYQTIPQTYLCKYDKYLCRRINEDRLRLALEEGNNGDFDEILVNFKLPKSSTDIKKIRHSSFSSFIKLCSAIERETKNFELKERKIIFGTMIFFDCDISKCKKYFNLPNEVFDAIEILKARFVKNCRNFNISETKEHVLELYLETTNETEGIAHDIFDEFKSIFDVYINNSCGDFFLRKLCEVKQPNG